MLYGDHTKLAMSIVECALARMCADVHTKTHTQNDQKKQEQNKSLQYV